MNGFFELSDSALMEDFKQGMHFLNLPFSLLGFLIAAFVTLSTQSYCVLYNGTFLSPTTQEQIYLPTLDMEIPGWRTVASVSGWKLSIRSSWDVLGPFPQHAREQHFLSPSFPFHSTLVYAAQMVCPDVLRTKVRTVSKSKTRLVFHHLSQMADLLHGPIRRPTARGSWRYHFRTCGRYDTSKSKSSHNGYLDGRTFERPKAGQFSSTTPFYAQRFKSPHQKTRPKRYSFPHC